MAINFTSMRVRLTFITECLGTKPSDPQVYGDYIAALAPDAPTTAEEVAAHGAAEVERNGTTIFMRNVDGIPYMEDYMWKGFFKEACSGLSRKGLDGKKPQTLSAGVTAYKKKIDLDIFVEPRHVLIDLNGGEMGVIQRPLRAQTMQGDRVALASSETIPVGSTTEFTVKSLNASDLDLVREWLDYGEVHGTGQWRNGSYGRFRWEELDDDGNVIGGNMDR